MIQLIKQNIISRDLSYDIILSSSIIEEKLNYYETNNLNPLYIVDENISKIYSKLLPYDKERVYIFTASEKNKSFKELIKIEEFLSKNNALRGSTLIALGGGITGDITGFAASIFMRGISFIQIPTTYLSMVDSSIGGKTGINFDDAKNIIGSFYQPKEVIIDMDFIDTLNDDEFLNGFAETIKIAAIADAEFFNMIYENSQKIIDRDKELLLEIIKQSCILKSNIVKEDTYETNKRMLLNFGHTFAHAIEIDSDNKITHGYAVALGMIYEMKYGVLKGYINEEAFTKIFSILEKFNYQTEYKIENTNIFLSALLKDKKSTSNGITIVLTDENMIGRIVEEIDAESLLTVFND